MIRLEPQPLQAPLLPVATSFIVGIVIAELLPSSPFTIFFSILGVVLCLIILHLLYRRKLRLNYGFSIAIIIILFASLGIARSHICIDKPQKPWPDGERVWRGIITDITTHNGYSRSTIQLTSYHEDGKWHAEGRKTECMLNTTHDDIKIGDGLIFIAHIRPPRNPGNPHEFDYAQWLIRKGFEGQAQIWEKWKKLHKTETRKQIDHLSWFLRLKIHTLMYRDRLTAQFRVFPMGDAEMQVVSTMTLGNRQLLTQDVRNLYAHSGVAHVLALSGLHLGILFGFLSTLMQPLRRKKADRTIYTLVCMATIWSYTFLTGMSISILRAALMYSLYVMVNFNRHEGTSLNQLCIAALIITLWNPQSVFDVGFQLSFLSVLTILCLMPYVRQLKIHHKPLRILYYMAMASIIAQTATAPLIIYYFHYVSFFFLPANLIVIPCIYFILIGTIFYFLFSPFHIVQSIFVQIIAHTASFLNRFLLWISHFPYHHIELYPTLTETLLIYVLLVAFFLLIIKHAVRYCLYVIVFVMGILGVLHLITSTKQESTQIIFYNTGTKPTVHFLLNNKQSYLWTLPHDSANFALRNISKNYWAPHHILQPVQFSEHSSFPQLRCNENIILFRKRRIAILSDDRWPKREVPQALPVDYLYLTKGYHHSLSDALRIFHPKMVIISASLPDEIRKQMATYCITHQLSYYDIAESGALSLILSD